MNARWISLVLAIGASLLAARTSRAEFELADGDRVVFLGGQWIEHEQLHGYWETMLVSHFPQRNVTVRNLGRSQDTVDCKVWESRVGANDGFEVLKAQIERLRPTVVFVGYGEHEARPHQRDLPHFRTKLEALLDMLAAVGKPRVVLMAPLETGQVGPDADLWHYTDLLHAIAVARDDTFVDLNRWLDPLREAQAGKRPFWTEDGTGLKLGYWLTAAALENDLLLRPSGWNLRLDARGKILESTGVTLDHLQGSDRGLAFDFRSTSLPLTAPLRKPGHSGQVRIEGLSAGRYQLKIDDQPLAAATAEEWAGGVALDVPAELKQLETLRLAIVRKNKWHLRREWPRVADDVFDPSQDKADLAKNGEKLLAEQEALIARLCVPAVHKFELVAAADEPGK